MSESPRPPFWGTFAFLREQIERLVALNLFWTLLLVPGAIGFAYSSLPLLVRTILVGLSALLVVPGSFAVYSVIARGLEGEEITLPEAWRVFREGAAQSFRTLAPLYVLLGALLGANVVVSAPTALLPLRLLLLFVLSSSLYWGPLSVQASPPSAVRLLGASFRLVFAHPARTLWAAFISLLLLVAGAISIGGLVLIVFVLLASYQTLIFLNLKG